MRRLLILLCLGLAACDGRCGSRQFVDGEIVYDRLSGERYIVVDGEPYFNFGRAVCEIKVYSTHIVEKPPLTLETKDE